MANEVETRAGIADVLARQYEMSPGDFWAVIRRTVVPDDATNEEVAGFLMVAKEYGLNPLTKQIHLFKSKKSGRMLATIGIDGWSAIANRNPDFDGVTFAFEWAEDGKPFACTATIHHKQRRHPVEVTEYAAECWRDTDAWRLTPARMLRHRAFAQAVRLCFGISGALDEDNPDLEPVDITARATESPVETPKPKSAPKAPPAAKKRATEAPRTDAAAPTIDGESRRVEDKPAVDTSALFRDFIGRLGGTKSDADIDALMEETDIVASLTHDEDSLELVETAVRRRRATVA
jgi:phage recombination protein Bet